VVYHQLAVKNGWLSLHFTLVKSKARSLRQPN